MSARSHGSPGEGSRRGTVGRAGLIAGALVFLGLYALFRALRQESFWGDGRFLVFWLENGRWGYYHLAYLPVAEVVQHTLGALLGWKAVDTLYFVSAASGAAAGAFLFLACTVAGTGRAPSAAAVALLASAPVVWFYSTSIEIHALQLLAASAALLWAARAWSRGRLGGNPVAPGVVLAGVSTSHLSGITWTPAMLFLAWAGKRGESRGRRLVGVLVCLIVFAAVYLGSTRFRLASSLADRAERFTDSPSPLGAVVREVLAPAAGIVSLALIALLDRARSDPRALLSRPAVTSFLIALALVPFAFLIDVAEHGAYFISLAPLFAFWVARWIERRRGLLVWALVAGAVGGQAYLAWNEVSEWEGVPVPPWVEELQAESGDETVLFTMDRQAGGIAFRHTRMIAFTIGPGAKNIDLSDAAMRKRALGVVQKRTAQGYRIAITRNVLEADDPATRSFVHELTQRFGEPVPGADPFYLLFPAGGGSR